MPLKKIASSKPCNLGAKNRASDDDFSVSALVDAQYNPDVIHTLLEELRLQMLSKCNQIQKDSDFAITSMQQNFHLELIKLPTQVKKMSLSKFKKEYGDSLEAVTRGAILGSLSSSLASKPFSNSDSSKDFPESAVKDKRNRQSMVFQTPMSNKGNQLSSFGIPETPATQRRNPRLGEEIRSVNGSPLGCFDTAVKVKPIPSSFSSLAPPPTPGVFVPLASGDVLNVNVDGINVDIENVDVAAMPEDVKQDALKQMQSMILNMQKLMQKLEGTAAV